MNSKWLNKTKLEERKNVPDEILGQPGLDIEYTVD